MITMASRRFYWSNGEVLSWMTHRFKMLGRSKDQPLETTARLLWMPWTKLQKVPHYPCVAYFQHLLPLSYKKKKTESVIYWKIYTLRHAKCSWAYINNYCPIDVQNDGNINVSIYVWNSTECRKWENKEGGVVQWRQTAHELLNIWEDVWITLCWGRQWVPLCTHIYYHGVEYHGKE